MPVQEAQAHHQGVLSQLSLGDLCDDTAEASPHTLDVYPFTQAGSGTTELGSNWTREGPVHGWSAVD